MEARPYRQVIADILFWHSVIYDEENRAIGVKDPALTMGWLQGKSRNYALCRVRHDIAIMLRERDAESMRTRGLKIFSLTTIGRIVGRHYSSVLNLLRPKQRGFLNYRTDFEVPKRSPRMVVGSASRLASKGTPPLASRGYVGERSHP